MRALIFNSGVGRRLGAFTRAHPKALLRLPDGESIFARQLRLLGAAGVDDIVVTTGPFPEQLADVAAGMGAPVRFVPNPDFATTNYLVSFALARPLVDGDDLLLLHGDLVFEGGVAPGLLADPRPDLVAVDATAPLPDKDFTAIVEDGIVRRIAVGAHGPGAVACQPLYKLSRRALVVWLDAVDALVAQGRTDVYAEDALNAVARTAAIRPFSHAGLLLAEIDDMADLARVGAALQRRAG